MNIVLSFTRNPLLSVINGLYIDRIMKLLSKSLLSVQENQAAKCRSTIQEKLYHLGNGKKAIFMSAVYITADFISPESQVARQIT